MEEIKLTNEQISEGIESENFWAFIDNENYPGFYKSNDISKYDRFYIFVGSTQRGIHTELVIKIQPLGDRVRYVLIEEVGKNNLDMHLLFYLGMAHQIAPQNTEFVIFSSDNDFDNVINHCNTRLKRKCTRIMDQGLLFANGSNGGEVIEENSIDFTKLYEKLKYHMNQINSSNRTSLPTRKATLVNFIASTVRMSGKTFNPDLLLEKLIHDGFVLIDSQLRVTYDMSSITPEMMNEYESLFAKPIYKPYNSKEIPKFKRKSSAVINSEKSESTHSLQEKEVDIVEKSKNHPLELNKSTKDILDLKSENPLSLKNEPEKKLSESKLIPKTVVSKPKISQSNTNSSSNRTRVSSNDSKAQFEKFPAPPPSKIFVPTAVDEILLLPDFAI